MKNTLINESDVRNKRLRYESNKSTNIKKWIRANSKVIIYTLLIAWLIASIFPFAWAFIASFNHYPNMSKIGINPIPKDGWTTENFKFLFNDELTRSHISKWLVNSLVFSILSAILNVVFNFLAGYALARIAFRGKKLYLWYMIAGMIIPGQVTQVPQLIILIKMGVIGDKATDAIFFAGIIFTAMTSASWVFMVRQFYLNIGPSTEEAGQLDGLSTFGVFWRISLRQMVPLMATMFAIIFMGCWNNFVMFTLWSGGSADRMNMVAGLTTVGKQASTIGGPNQALAVTLAATNIAVIPVLITYFASLYFQRKQVIEGEK